MEGKITFYLQFLKLKYLFKTFHWRLLSFYNQFWKRIIPLVNFNYILKNIKIVNFIYILKNIKLLRPRWSIYNLKKLKVNNRQYEEMEAFIVFKEIVWKIKEKKEQKHVAHCCFKCGPQFTMSLKGKYVISATIFFFNF